MFFKEHIQLDYFGESLLESSLNLVYLSSENPVAMTMSNDVEKKSTRPNFRDGRINSCCQLTVLT